MALSNPIALYNAQNNLDAILVQRFLESHGVEAFAVEDNSIAGHWIFGTPPAIQKPQVWVNREHAERAAQLLIEYEQLKASRDAARKTNEPKTIMVQCGKCGRESEFAGSLDGSVQDCPHCGSYVDVGHFDWPGDDDEESDNNINGALQPARMIADDSKSPAIPYRARRAICLEIAVVLCLGVLPPFVYALDDYFNADLPNSSFVWEMLFRITDSFQVIVPLLYIISRSSVSWSTFAITRFRPFVDSFLGLSFFVVLFLVTLTTTRLGPSIDTASNTDFQRLIPVGLGEYLLLFVAMSLNSVCEELLVRAYLITRLRHLGLSAVSAVLVASALWASYHIYQGNYAALQVFVEGLVYGALFVVSKRLWPLVIAHTLYNFLVYASAAFT